MYIRNFSTISKYVGLYFNEVDCILTYKNCVIQRNFHNIELQTHLTLYDITFD